MSRRIDPRHPSARLSSPGRPSEVRFEIGELVLAGVPAADRPRVAEAVRSQLGGALGAELARRLGSGAPLSGASIPVELPVLRVSLGAPASSPAFARSLSAAVGTALGTALGTAPGPAPGSPAASHPASLSSPGAGAAHRSVLAAPSISRPGPSAPAPASAGPGAAAARGIRR